MTQKTQPSIGVIRELHYVLRGMHLTTTHGTESSVGWPIKLLKSWVKNLPTFQDHPCETWDDTEFVQMGFEFHPIHDDYDMLNT